MIPRILQRCAGAVVNAWGGAVVGALVGQVVGAVMGPALGSMRLAEMLQKMVDEGAFPEIGAWVLDFIFNWMPGASLAKGIVGMICGFMAGIGVGTIVGAGVGLVAGFATTIGLGSRRLVIPSASRVNNSAIDYFLAQRLSRGLEGLAIKHAIGVGLGLVIAESLWIWSKNLPVDAPGPGYLVYATFGLVDAALMGATIGYLAASLCVTLQRIAPWALAGTIPGVLWMQLAPQLGTSLGQGRSSGALAIMGAMLAHGACLFIGPLRGKWSIAREGAFVALALGWLVLDNPFAGMVGFLGFVVIGWSVPAWRPVLVLEVTNAGPAPTGTALPVGSFFWSGKALLGGLLGSLLGMFTGYLGGLPLWLLAGSVFMHRKLITERWLWAKAQVNLPTPATSTIGLGAPSLGVASVSASVLAPSWLGAVAGFLLVSLSLASAAVGFLTENRSESASTMSAQQTAPRAADTAIPTSSVPSVRQTTSNAVEPSVAAPTLLASTPTASTSDVSPPPTASALTDAEAVTTHTSGKVLPPEASALEQLLHRYYADLNSGDFDANRYFAPSVERFVSRLGTTTSWINNYIRTTFPKQFKEHHFEMEPNTLTADGMPGQYTFIEHSRYLLVAKNKRHNARWRVRVRVDHNGKLVHFRQFERAEP